jgi:spermidine/putrescine transport system substrate-binding protein
MSPLELRTRIRAHAVDRREFNKILASVGIVSLSMPLLARSARSAASLQVFTWANYNLPEQFSSYTEKYGQPPEFSILTENDEARAKLRGGFRPDIVVPTESYAPFFIKDNLLDPIDVSRLTHWPELFDKMRNTASTMGPNGEHYHLPWAWGTNGVVFRTDLAPEYVGNPTWTILFDPKFKGRIAMRDAPNGVIIPAALIMRAKDPYDLTDDELGAIGEMLRKQRELVRFYWKSEAEIQQALAAGEITAAYGWNTAYTTLKRQGVPVEYMVPKEGMPIWLDGYSLVKGGSAPDQQKYDYLDAVLSPECGAFNIQKLSYGASNRKSYSLVDAKLLADLGMANPDEILAKGLWAKVVPQATLRKMSDLHNRVKSGF